MSYATIQVTLVTPRIGAVVSGIDLAAKLSNQQVDDIHTALADHQVLFSLIKRSTWTNRKPLAGILVTSTFTRTRQAQGGIPRSCRSMSTRTPNVPTVKTGTSTCPATSNRQWGPFSICTPCRRRSLPASQPRMTR
jgi:hypothetical protein